MINMEISKRRVVSDSHNTTDIFVVIIMFCVFHALKGKRKTVNLDYLNFCFESVINSYVLDDVKFVKPWGINKSLKPILIMMVKQGLLNFQVKNYNLEILISEYGILYLNEIMQNSLFTEINQSAASVTQKISAVKLNKQKFIW